MASGELPPFAHALGHAGLHERPGRDSREYVVVPCEQLTELRPNVGLWELWRHRQESTIRRARRLPAGLARVAVAGLRRHLLPPSPPCRPSRSCRSCGRRSFTSNGVVYGDCEAPMRTSAQGANRTRQALRSRRRSRQPHRSQSRISARRACASARRRRPVCPQGARALSATRASRKRLRRSGRFPGPLHARLVPSRSTCRPGRTRRSRRSSRRR